MNHPRWYPTAINMPDGSVIVFSGRGDDDGDDIPEIIQQHEILSPPNYIPTVLDGFDLVLPKL
ncbi:MAG: hypothetical protein V3U87_11360 [Methylococcaceae bacterium]